MDKNIQEIIKRAAQRYGLKYNKNSDNVTVRSKDGTVKKLSYEDMIKTFKDE